MQSVVVDCGFAFLIIFNLNHYNCWFSKKYWIPRVIRPIPIGLIHVYGSVMLMQCPGNMTAYVYCFSEVYPSNTISQLQTRVQQPCGSSLP